MITKNILKPLGAMPAALLLIFLSIQFCLLFLFNTSVPAKTSFVKPSSEVVVRRGQGTDYKIIAMIKDGTSVEFLEESNNYARVRLANGKEGWMLKRFLSDEPPLKELVVSLRTEREEMKQKELKTNQKLEAITSTLSQTEYELDATLEERDQLKTAFQTLQEDTADVVQIKKNLDKTARENKALTQKLALVKQESDNLRNDSALKWFLAGAGALLLGIIIGRMPSRPRRRKPSLL
ncbi:MAG TPA: TIGR04211 family SH3 domain-containing protein [Desulfobacterales bacterium]|nr:TIGR04211 family SH3 domain-containing protein [Desulfobacterales bacterium]HIP40002.1 TIGR04211 family SH3 domain-containing protein [Desulfocapsa sulfexigens]